MKQSEADIRANKPIELFVIDGKSYKVKARCMNDADDWCALAREVEIFDDAVKKAITDLSRIRESIGQNISSKENIDSILKHQEILSKAKRDYNHKLLEVVLAYDTTALPREQLEGKLTSAQVVSAFHDLIEITDPFLLMQAHLAEMVKKQLEGLPESLTSRALAAIR